MQTIFDIDVRWVTMFRILSNFVFFFMRFGCLLLAADKP